MMHEAVTFGGLVAMCLWYGVAMNAGHSGQACVAALGALVFGALMYL
jgi:hypothetical protein